MPSFENTKITKVWYQAMGGDTEAVELTILYEKNDNKYKLKIATNKTHNSCKIYKGHEILDKDLSNLLESDVTEKQNTEIKSDEKFFYIFKDCDSSILYKY